MDIKLTEKEILDYAIAEEGLLFASSDDYLAIAEIVIEQINIKLKSAQPTPNQSDDEPFAYYVYVENYSQGYFVDSLDDPQCVDDCTNADAKVTPLYTKPQTTSQDAERWQHFACNQTAMMLGSKLEPMDASVNWLEECNKLADAAMKEGNHEQPITR